MPHKGAMEKWIGKSFTGQPRDSMIMGRSYGFLVSGFDFCSDILLEKQGLML